MILKYGKKVMTGDLTRGIDSEEIGASLLGFGSSESGSSESKIAGAGNFGTSWEMGKSSVAVLMGYS